MNHGATKKSIHYAGLLTVILVWGLDPIVNSYFYRYFSPTALTTISTFFPALFFTAFAARKLSALNASYFKIAIPISLLNSIACLMQKIGLKYTTPATYAFLEHLSCVMVPLSLLLFFRNKPRSKDWLAAGLCFVGCFVLCGMDEDAISLGVGELLCGGAGLLLGICIVLPEIYVAKLDISLYMMIYMWVYFLTSLALSFGLNAVTVHGMPLETLTLSAEPLPLIALILFGFLSMGLCWLFRTNASIHLSSTVVAVFSPFAAVVTGVISVIVGTDRLSVGLLVGGTLILVALLLSAFDTFPREKGPLP